MKLDEQELSRAMDDAVGGVRPATGDTLESFVRAVRRAADHAVAEGATA